MSLITPTTKEINDNIIAQLEASLNQTIPLLPKSFLRVLARALSGVFIILYKYAGFIFLQIFVRTASFSTTTINGKEVSPLIEWGRLIGIGDPAAATNAELLIDITVTNQTGVLPSGSQLVNSDNGVTYITIGSVALDAATVQATIRAVSDQSDGGGEGVIGNLDPAAIVSFANPLANVARDAVVVSQVVTGADGEAIELYRQRIIDKFQRRPQGGAYSDYVIWGTEPAGIVNIFPYTSTTPGIVDVFVEATPESSGDPDGIPTEAQLIEVDESIQFDENGLASRRPATALVQVLPITRIGFDVTVTGVTVPGSLGDVQAQITAAITEYLLAREPFILGLTIGIRTDRITITAIGGDVDDIVSAAGGTFTSVTMALSSGGGDITEFTLGNGEKAKLGTITYD